MSGVLIGFAIIAVVIGAGWFLARSGLFGPEAERVMSRLAFTVLSPALLFTTLAQADLGTLFGRDLPVAAISVGSVVLLSLLVSFLVLRRRPPEAVVNALAAGYSNAANIGIPVSVYVLGDATASAPVIMLQLCLFAPVALTVLDVSTSGETSLWRVLRKPLQNPLIIGSLLGLVVALTDWHLPGAVLAPFELVGGAAVPVILLGFGMSLARSRVLDARDGRRDVLVSSVLKLVVMPAVAWLTAYCGFGMRGHDLFAAVALAALPSAQNVFNYAQRYQRGVIVARDTVFITTIASVAVLVAVAWILAP